MKKRKHTFREKINIRITKGIKLLKKHYGEDFFLTIDTENLDLISPESCMIGQLSGGSFSRPLKEIYIKECDANPDVGALSREVWDFGRKYGFSLYGFDFKDVHDREEVKKKWKILNEEWKKRTQKLRSSYEKRQ